MSKVDLDRQTLALIMDSNRDGTGMLQAGLFKDAYACFKHALRWCPSPHELASTPLSSPDSDAVSREMRRYQWTLRRAAIANNLAMAAIQCGWTEEALRLLERDVIGGRKDALGLVGQLFDDKRAFEETQLSLAIAVAHRHVASVLGRQPGSYGKALEHLKLAETAIQRVVGQDTPDIPRHEVLNQLGFTLNNIGIIAWKQAKQDPERAKERETTALESFQRAAELFLQTGHLDYKVSLQNQIQVHKRWNQPDQIEHLTQLIASFEPRTILDQDENQTQHENENDDDEEEYEEYEEYEENETNETNEDDNNDNLDNTKNSPR